MFVVFIRPSSDGSFYGMVMSVRPSIRPSWSPSGSLSVNHSFPHFSSTCFDILSWNFVCHFLLLNIQSSSSVVNFRQFCWSYAPYDTLSPGNTQFSALFYYRLWHIELKIRICLCYTGLQIKLECRQFASMFVGVMPLLELIVLEIHSFPHFLLHALTHWAEILHMPLLYCTTDQVWVSSICVNGCRIYALFWT